MAERKKEWYTVYDQIKKSVVMIEVRGSVYALNREGKLAPYSYVTQRGSGFIYSREDGKLGLITAYHVVRRKEGERLKVWVLTKQNERIEVNNCTISPSSDEDKDVAILSFNPPGKSIEDFETVGFPRHAFEGKILKTGVDIAWCGYPATIGPFIPIFQKGTIAGYHRSRYIVDGMPNPGSSGGPIFYNYSKEIVGMITAHAPEPSSQRLAIVEGEQNRVTQVFRSPSGLGMAVPAAEILRVFGIKSK